jgi:hypothetical protein
MFSISKFILFCTATAIFQWRVLRQMVVFDDNKTLPYLFLMLYIPLQLKV